MIFKHVLRLVLFVMIAAAPLGAHAQGQAPDAAPTGAPAVSAPLAAPSAANVDVVGGMGDSGGFSIVSSFLRADIVVKAVMVLLALASLWSWAIIFNKWIALSGRAERSEAQGRQIEKIFWSGQSLDELYQQFAAKNDHPLAAVFIAALREWRRAFEAGAPRESQVAGIKERIDKAMNVTIIRETDGIERQLGFLATVGSVSPFIGLFGTVWGIMNSFSAIAARHDTTLAVVAPGIAEALFATAMGLAAAVPAVIFYNRFINEIGRYANGWTPLPMNSPPSCRGNWKTRFADGATLQPGMTGGRRGRRGRRRAMAEINVTPFVDVMLVLLIVFMVTAPLLTVGVPVDLPKTRAPALGQDKEPLSVTISKNGKIFLQKEVVAEDALVAKLTAISNNGYDQRIFVRGDKSVDYGRVMEVMGLLSQAGFTHIGLVTDAAKPKPDAR